MAIIHMAPARRVWPGATLAGAAVCVGVALAWVWRSVPPQPAATQVSQPVIRMSGTPAPRVGPVDRECDAQCALATVIGPATKTCTAAIEELAGFGARWADADAAGSRFDRISWLQKARGTVTLAGGRAEFRNAAGAYTPVEYDCDFDPATLTVLGARARPRLSAP